VEKDPEHVQVWGVVFTIPGNIRVNGEISEAKRRQLEKFLTNLLSNWEIPL